MNYYTLQYKTVPDYIERRGMYRTEHLDLVKKSFERGEIILGGAMEPPVMEVLIVFKSVDESIPTEFAKSDPYVLNGIVESWEVTKWNVVIGN